MRVHLPLWLALVAFACSAHQRPCETAADCPAGALCVNGSCSGAVSSEDVGSDAPDTDADGSGTLEPEPPPELACGRAEPGCTAGAPTAVESSWRIRCPAAPYPCDSGWRLCDAEAPGADEVACCAVRAQSDPCCERFGVDCPAGHGFRCDTSGAEPICLSDDGANVFVAGGTTLVGCRDGEADPCPASELPVTSVSVPPFALERREATTATYLSCLGQGSCQAPSTENAEVDPYESEELQPASWLTPDRAYGFCHWWGGRLPSESEWERAARGPEGTGPYPWGATAPTCDGAVFGAQCGDAPDLADPSERLEGASGFGAIDMAGNVTEWTADCAADDLSALPGDGSPNSHCGTGLGWTGRGGDFLSPPSQVRVSSRAVTAPATGGEPEMAGRGVRCARELVTSQFGCAPGLRERDSGSAGVVACAGSLGAWGPGLDTGACAPGWRVCGVADLVEREVGPRPEWQGAYHLSDRGCPLELGRRWSDGPGPVWTLGAEGTSCASSELCSELGCAAAPVDEAVTGVLCCAEQAPPAAPAGVVLLDATPSTDASAGHARALVGLADGSLVAVWRRTRFRATKGDIWHRRFGPDGRPQGPPRPADAGAWHDKRQPAVAGLRFGGYAIVFTSHGEDSGGLDEGIYARVYDQAGVPVAGVKHVSIQAAGPQREATIAALPDGGAVVVYASVTYDGSRSAVIARRLTPWGDPTGDEVTLHELDLSRTGTPMVTPTSTGGYGVAWVASLFHDEVWWNLYDAKGNPLQQVQRGLGGQLNHNRPVIAALDTGGVAIVWRAETSGSEHASALKAALQPPGKDAIIGDLNPGAIDAPEPHDLLRLADGRFVLLWSGDVARSGGHRPVFLTQLDAELAPVITPTRLDPDNVGLQQGSSLTRLSDGGFAALWFTEDEAGQMRGRLARFDAEGNVRPPGDEVAPGCPLDYLSDCE